MACTPVYLTVYFCIKVDENENISTIVTVQLCYIYKESSLSSYIEHNKQRKFF